MSPKKQSKQEKEQQKQNIIDAAIKVFSKKGYTKTTVEEISKKAGVAKGLIYYYFKNKDAVFRECISSIRTQMKNYIEENVDPELSAFERIRQRTLNLLKFFTDNREKFILFTDQSQNKKLSQKERKRMLKEFLEGIDRSSGRFEEAKAEGTIAEDSDCRSLSLMLYAIVNMFMSYSLIAEEKLDPQKIFDEIDKHFLANLKVSEK